MLAALGETPTVTVEFDTPPGPTTVQVVRDDATVVATGSATVSGTLAQFALPATATARVAQLVCAFTAQDGRVANSVVEVVGGWLCDLAAIDTVLARGGNPTAYTAVAKRAARAAAQETIEQACSVRFAPRWKRVTVASDGGTLLDTRVLLVRRVLRATDSAGQTVNVSQASPVGDGGMLTNPEGWPAGTLTVDLEHGMATAPVDVARACAILAASMLADGPWDDRGFSVSDELGAFRLLTAGVGGAHTSIPEVESAIRRWRHVPIP